MPGGILLQDNKHKYRVVFKKNSGIGYDEYKGNLMIFVLFFQYRLPAGLTALTAIPSYAILYLFNMSLGPVGHISFPMQTKTNFNPTVFRRR